MPPADSREQAFVNQVLAYAQVVSRESSVLVSVILAQWADETAWGTSEAWVDGHNPAGISPGGVIASYPSISEGVDSWLATILDPLYNDVRLATGWNAQALALGESPWAAGHYELGGVPGAALVAIITEQSLWQYDQPAGDVGASTSTGGSTMDTDTAQLLVGLLYRVCLHRAPDEDGFLTNVEALTSGKATGAQVMANIQMSAEGQAVLAAERHALGLPA